MTEIQGLESLAPAVQQIDIEGRPERPGSQSVEGIAPITAAANEPILFDSEAYNVAPKIDGQAADKIVIRFGGSVSFDASDAEGRALFEKLALGRDVDLRVSGHVAAKNGAYKFNATTEEEVVTGTAGIKIDTLYLLAPEDLG